MGLGPDGAVQHQSLYGQVCDSLPPDEVARQLLLPSSLHLPPLAELDPPARTRKGPAELHAGHDHFLSGLWANLGRPGHGSGPAKT